MAVTICVKRVMRAAEVVNQNIKHRTMKKNNIKFVVNLTEIESCDDIQLEFIKGKALAGVAITEDEFKFIVHYGAQLAFDTIDACLEAFIKSDKYTKIEDDKLAQDILKLIEKSVNPKKPWYKRFWGWVTKPFKKNK